MADFDARDVLSDETWAAMTRLRVDDPEAVMAAARRRRKRPHLTADGRLVIVAADHPARMVTDVHPGDGRMADRRDFLGRVIRALSADGVDGVMATPDVIEELLLVELVPSDPGSELLAEKLLIGCMNRGGLAGAAWELDDRMTAFTPDRLVEMALDGAKVMCRLSLTEPACLDTLVACAEAITECASRRLPVFLEVFMVEHTDEGWRAVREPRSLTQAVSVASALGATSLGTWLKLPCCEGFEQVARATTLPILMLGGAARGDDLAVLAEFAAGMAAGPNVRGCLVGRNVLYSASGDPLVMAAAVGRVVHDGLGPAEAYEKSSGG